MNATTVIIPKEQINAQFVTMSASDNLAIKAFIWGCVAMSIPYVGWIFGIAGLKFAKEALSRQQEFNTVKAAKTFATCGKVFSIVGIAGGLALLAFLALYFIAIFGLIAHGGF